MLYLSGLGREGAVAARKPDGQSLLATIGIFQQIQPYSRKTQTMGQCLIVSDDARINPN
jgi:hypothetical protein